MFKMYLFFVVTLLPLFNCKELTLKKIFLETKKAIFNNSTKQMQDVLSKYYFTVDKERSIWYHAQEETYELFGLDHDQDSLLFLETLLKRLAGHYTHCITMEKNVARGQCFAELSSLLKDTEKGARWHTDPDMEVGEKTKFGTLYNSIAAMSAVLSVLALHEMGEFDNVHERNEKIHRFEHVIFKMISDMQGSNEFDHDVVEFRLDQISPVTICDIKTHFWKEYEGACETRWTNMAFDNSHKNQIKLRSEVQGAAADVAKSPKKVKSEGGDHAKETESEIPEDEQNRNTVADNGIDAATLIGGDLGPVRKRYRTSVIDASNNKLIYEKFFIADVGSRADKMDKATAEALEKRGEEELKVKEDVMAHINGTFYINMKLLRKTLEYLKV